MKKMSILFVAILLLLTACGSGGESKQEVSGTNTPQEASTVEVTSNTAAPEAENFAFEVNGVEIAVHAEIAPILASLGESQGYFEAESCALPGMEKTYSYNGFDLLTYELNGVDYIQSIIFTDDTVATDEGVSLFASLDDVVKTYGEDYSKELDLYTYKKDRSQVSFLIENGEVASVEYVAIHN